MDGNKHAEVLDRPPQNVLPVTRANEFLKKLSKEQRQVDEVGKITDRAIACSYRFLRLFPVCHTAAPAMQLVTFNFIRDHPDALPSDVLKELGRKREQVREEHDATTDKQIPSIGLELEIPYRLFPFDTPEFADMRQALTRMNIPIYGEPSGNFPTEFQFHPTHTAALQTELIKNLENYVPDETIFSSIHINLGVPKDKSTPYDKEKEERERERILKTATAISDIITLAYVPSNRIESRAQQPSVQIHNTKSIKEESEAYRIELRTPQLRNDANLLNDLFTNTQILGCFLGPDGKSFDKTRQEFEEDVEKFLSQYDLETDFPFHNKQKGVKTIRKAEVQKTLAGNHEPIPENVIDNARSLIKKYVDQINEVRDAEQSEKLREELQFAAD